MIVFCEVIQHATTEPTEGFCFLDTISGEICHFEGEWFFTKVTDFLLWAGHSQFSSLEGVDRYTSKISVKYGGEVDYDTD